MDTITQRGVERGRPLIPDVCSDVEHERLFHDDIDTLTSEMLRAEQVLLTLAWAEAVFAKRKPREVPLTEMSDRQWLEERLRRLKAEEKRRQTPIRSLVTTSDRRAAAR